MQTPHVAARSKLSGVKTHRLKIMARVKGRPRGGKGQATSSKKKLKGSFKKGKMKTVKQKGMKSLGKSRDEIEKTTSSKSPSFDEAGHKGDGQSPADSKPSIKKAKAVPLNKKERKICRRQQKEDYVLTSAAKTSWERLRRHQLVASERKELMEKLMASIQGQIHQLSVKHDTARVIQCCLKYGSRGQRSAVFSELKDHIVELSKLKYAKFTVKSLLKYCTSEERGHLISCLYGHVRRLVRHSEAAEILEIAYNDYANAAQRSALVKEFYGPQFSLFRDEPVPLSLAELLKEKPELRASVMKHLKEAILPLLEKKVVIHNIVHRALFEFFNNSNNEERSEMVEAIKEVVVHMLHTKEGSRVAMTTLWHGTAKDRKAVLKSFKTYIVKICKEEHGHLVMMSLFDSVDDTVMVRKIILSEVIPALDELCHDPFGRRVLLYLLAPRCPTHFSPQFIAVLSGGDGNATSKKDPAVRQNELRAAIISPLLQLAERRVVSWARSKCHAPLLLQIADSASSAADLGNLYSALVGELCTEFDSVRHLVVNDSAHWVIKRLLVQDKGRDLALLILDKVAFEQLQLWSGSNRGAFVLSSLVRHLDPSIARHRQLADMLRKTLSSVHKLAGDHEDQVTNTNTLKGQLVLIKQLDDKFSTQPDK